MCILVIKYLKLPNHRKARNYVCTNFARELLREFKAAPVATAHHYINTTGNTRHMLKSY
jgi:hypothetical protein